MKFIVDNRHHEYFQHHGAIEFEELLSDEEVITLRGNIDGEVSRRCSVDVDALSSVPSIDLFRQGRDLWRSSDDVKKMVCSWRLAEIAAQLTHVKPLRLAYDQLLMTTGAKPQGITFFDRPVSLEEVSCFQGMTCGLLLRLSESSQQHIVQLTESEATIVPQQIGSGVYFGADKLFDFGTLFREEKQCFLFVAYTKARTVYVLREGDPHCHHLKRLGYVFGDKLDEQRHPVVYR